MDFLSFCGWRRILSSSGAERYPTWRPSVVESFNSLAWLCKAGLACQQFQCTTKTLAPKRRHLLVGSKNFNLANFVFSLLCIYPNYLLGVGKKKKKKTDLRATKELIGSLPTCQEPLWSFFSGRQTGRRSSHSRWRRCHSRRASWGKHQTRFLRGTFHCP